MPSVLRSVSKYNAHLPDWISHEGVGLVLPATQDMEDGQATFVAAHDLPIDQDRPDPEMVHCLDDERIPGSPVVAIARQQPDARGVAPGHHSIAVVSWTQFGPVGGSLAVNGRHGAMKVWRGGIRTRLDMAER
jgi:hypothetical protein